jgi:hypothetical protein
LPADKLQFAVKPVLENLRANCGDSEFGYRMQALFAHVLMRLGATVLEINAKGHPDIKALMGQELMLVQVKSAGHSGPSSMFSLSDSDFAGIASDERAAGYLAFLDCAAPVSWHIVKSGAAGQLRGRFVPVESIVAMRDETLSVECSEVFAEMILSIKDRLGVLTFAIVSARALNGKEI